MLLGLEPSDPSTNASAIIGVAIITGFAAFGPALRASRIDPVSALGDYSRQT
jgi:hypothetical protein